jgi:ABC-type lipoprotein release transport system permease subunit
MRYIFSIAFRNIKRNRRRSFFSALALGIGLSLLLFMAAFVEGEMRSALGSSIKLSSGHIQVRAKSYEEGKNSLAWDDLVQNPEEVAAKIAALEPVKVATPRLFANGILETAEDSVGVQILGIDPLSEANAPYQNGLVSGEFIKPDDRQGIMIGKSLAEKLRLEVEDQVNLLVNTSDGDVDEQVFIIRGIYNTHTPGIDNSTVLMPLAKAQTITRTEDHASTIFILLKDQDETDAVVAALKSTKYKILDWRDLNSLLVEIEQFANSFMVLFYLIVLGITATVIINTLIMAVFERTREIGILASLGMRGRGIMALFFAESLLLAVGGVVIGVILGGIMVALTAKYGIYMGDMGLSGILLGERIYAHLTLKDAITLITLTFIITVLAALYPAWLAAKMEPVEALHSGE